MNRQKTKLNKHEAKEKLHADRMVRRVLAEGRTLPAEHFDTFDRVVSNGVGVLAIPEGTTGTVVFAYPGEEWKDDMSGWTSDLEWLYAVLWDDKEQNNPGNKPTGCRGEMLELLPAGEKP